MKNIAFISCFYNPANFKRPVKNCTNFLKFTVNSAFPKDDFFFAQLIHSKEIDVSNYIKPENYLNIKTNSILWHKERSFNLLLEKFNLLERYKYICWLDCDIWFDKPITEVRDCTIYQPYRYSFRSKVERNIDFTKPFHLDGEKYESLASNPKGDKGLSWCIESEYLDEIGGFFDYGIVGGGDTFFINRVFGKKMYTGCIGLDNEINQYAENSTLKKKDMSYLDRNVYHQYHGKTINRQYDERIKILRKYEFNPQNDLTTEKSGLYSLKNKEFEQDILHYFKNRNEDN